MVDAFTLLICGKIRDGDVFNRDLSVYEEWQQRGLIRSIVFSGWREDIHDGCIGRLEQMGAKIVLTDPPDFRSAGNIFHQMKAMHFGLRLIPDNDVVLKSRTDKVWLNFDPAEVLGHFSQSPACGPLSPFRHRLHVTAMLPLQPFFINDMMYMGLAGDIARMVSFDMWFEMEQAQLNAEQIFHYYPHAQGDDVWRQFYRINPGLMHGDPAKARAVQRILLGNGVFQQAVAHYLLAFEQGYSLGLTPRSGFVPPAQETVDELLAMEPSESWDGIRFAGSPNTLEVVNDEAVSHLLDMPLSAADSRTLRAIAAEPRLEPQAVRDLSEAAVNAILAAYPDQHPRPTTFERQGGCEILRSHVRYLYPNDV